MSSSSSSSSSSFDDRSNFEITTTGVDTIGIVTDNASNLRIDWGDGNVEFVTGGANAETTHEYSGSGTWILTLQGSCTRFRFLTGATKLTAILSPLKGCRT